MSSTMSGADPISTYPVTDSHAGHIAHPKPVAVTRTPIGDAPPSHGRAIVLPLTGLACIGTGLIAANLSGEFARMGGFLAITSGSFFSATKDVMYPSAHVYLGMVMAGPAGGLMIGALAACMGTGLLALRAGRGWRVSTLGRVLGLIAALLLPLLLLDYMIYSAIEFTSAQAMLWAFDDQPSLQRVWVPVALGCATAMCLSADWLIARWAWRRVSRPAVTQREPARV